VKKLVGLALACTGLMVAAAVVYAAESDRGTWRAEAKMSKRNAGTAAKPTGSRLDLEFFGGQTGPPNQPPTTKQLRIGFPVGPISRGRSAQRRGTLIKVRTGIVPRRLRCSPNTTDERNCPQRGKLGEGHVTSLGGNGNIREEIEVTAWPLTNGNLGLFLRGTSPAVFALMLQGKFRGNVLVVDIPQNVQQPVAGIKTGISELSFFLRKQFRVRGVLRNIVETVGCNRRAGWVFVVTAVYDDNSRDTDRDRVPCRK
jgi:hypothetical protein